MNNTVVLCTYKAKYTSAGFETVLITEIINLVNYGNLLSLCYGY